MFVVVVSASLERGMCAHDLHNVFSYPFEQRRRGRCPVEIVIVIALVIGVARGIRGRNDRKARATVARALRGTSSTDAKFARYPGGRWSR